MGLASAALMPNIVRPSPAAHRRAGAILATGAPGCGSRGTLRQFEAQRTVHRIGLDQPQLEPLAARIGVTAFLADQRMRLLVIPKILRAQRRYRHQPVAA